MQTLVPVTREEKYLHAIVTHGEVNITPVTTEEKLLDSIVRDEPIAVNPKTRREYFLNEIVNSEQTNKTYILEPVESIFANGSCRTSELVLTQEQIDEIYSNHDFKVGVNDSVLALNEDNDAFKNDEYIFNVTTTTKPNGTVVNTFTLEAYSDEDEDYISSNDTVTVSIYTETDGSNDSETRFLTPVTREEKYLHAIATHGDVNLTPVTTEEKLLDAYLNGDKIAVNPKTRKEYFVALATGATIVGGEDERQVAPFPGMVDAAPIDEGGGNIQ